MAASYPFDSTFFPYWETLPIIVQTRLREAPTLRLWDPDGLLAFRYSTCDHRIQMVVELIHELALKIDSGRDHSIAATYLANYFGHSVGLYLRANGDLNSRDFYVADERHQVHRLVSNAEALQTVCGTMNFLIETIDNQLLHGKSPSTHRLEIERLKDNLKKPEMVKQRPQLQEQIRCAHQFLAIRSMFTSNSNKLSIAREYISKVTADCLKRGDYLQLSSDRNWFSMPNGYDLNLLSLKTRRRCLDHHILGLSNAVFTIPVDSTSPIKLSKKDHHSFFGPIPALIHQLAAENTNRAKSILVSLYLQLLGHNKHKYLIFFIGGGNNGKSLLLSLLRESMGQLCSPLHKSVLFGGTKDSASHSGFDVQLDFIRSGLMDDLGPRDQFNEQAVKTIVSPDVELVMREAGHTRRGAAKARYQIQCSLLLCCNYGSMPKIKMDQALLNRFRIIPFEATFGGKADSDKKSYPSFPGLLDKLKKPKNLSCFLNYVVMAGHYYYHQNIRIQGEPLINEPNLWDQFPTLESPASSLSLISSFELWWQSHVVCQPGESIPIAVLASAYYKSSPVSVAEVKKFGQLLQTYYPEVVKQKKKQLMATVDGVRTKRMTLLDHQLLG